ncbi:prosaposin-like isoform X2 [Watersipora subatra]|uniref:prosaposin-like isoform X2 n=1 Tax=Watersipora subatra TaxID=2589382 RepID=UPI00355C113A
MMFPSTFTVVVATLLLSDVNAALLSSRGCSLGPSYWCSNILTAKECYAMQYCLEHNWKDAEQPTLSKVQVGDDQACNMCKTLVKDIKAFLSDNSTQEEIFTQAEMLCSTIPDDYLVNECKNIIQHYIAQGLDMVISALDPVVICTSARICDGRSVSWLDHVKDNIVSNIVEAGVDYCSLCEETAVYLYSLAIINGTEQAVKNQLLQEVCPKLKEKSFIKACESAVQNSFPQLWAQALAALKTPNATCAKVGFCSAQKLSSPSVDSLPQLSLSPAAVKSGASGNSSVCKICKDAVALIERELVLEKAMIEDRVKGVCQQLSFLEAECEKVTQQVIDTFFNVASQMFNNGSCFQWSLCPSNHLLSLSNKFDDEDGADSCATCEKAVANLYILATKSGMKGYVKDEIIKEVCDKMKSEFERLECKLGVDAGFSSLWSMLLDSLKDANSTCAKVGFCRSVSSLSKGSSEGITSECQVCESAVLHLQASKGETTQQVREELNTFCSLLPVSEFAECNMIEEHSEIIAFRLHQGAAYADICEDLKLCKIRTQPTRLPWYMKY